MIMLHIIEFALIPTILIELAVLVLLKERNIHVLGSSVVANILTNIPLNLYIIHVNGSLTTILLGEILVIFVEALWYYIFLRRLSTALVYSFLCNAISFLAGLLYQLLQYCYYQL